VKTDLLLVPFAARWSDMRDCGVAAEASGFDGLWTWDHLSGVAHDTDRVLEAWTILSALASVVPRVAIGPLVLNVSTRHPAVLANMAATLQEVSGGRLLLGLGAGGGRHSPYPAEQEAIGVPVEGDAVRRSRVSEAIEVMRRLWTGGEGFAGDHYTLHGTDGFLRPDPAPPVVVGAFGPKMATIAGRHGDGLNTQASHPQLPSLVETARAARAETGRDPFSLLVTVFAGMSEEWLRPDHPKRAALQGLGVDRLALLVDPPYATSDIEAAGRLLDP